MLGTTFTNAYTPDEDGWRQVTLPGLPAGDIAEFRLVRSLAERGTRSKRIERSAVTLLPAELRSPPDHGSGANWRVPRGSSLGDLHRMGRLRVERTAFTGRGFVPLGTVGPDVTR